MPVVIHPPLPEIHVAQLRTPVQEVGDSERIQNNIPGDATGIEDWIKEEGVQSEEKRHSGFSL